MTSFATSDKVSLSDDVEDSIVAWLQKRGELSGVTITNDQEESHKLFPSCQIEANILREHPRKSGIYTVRVKCTFEWKPAMQMQQPAAWAVILGMLHWDNLPQEISNDKFTVYGRSVKRNEVSCGIAGDRHTREASIEMSCYVPA